MVDRRLPLAELHLHMYGTIRAEDYLERLGAREVDWRFYETTFERAWRSRSEVVSGREAHGGREAQERLV